MSQSSFELYQTKVTLTEFQVHLISVLSGLGVQLGPGIPGKFRFQTNSEFRKTGLKYEIDSINVDVIN